MLHNDCRGTAYQSQPALSIYSFLPPLSHTAKSLGGAQPWFARIAAARLVYAEDRAIYKHEKLYSILSYMNDGAITMNLRSEEGEEERIYNVRGEEQNFSLDGQGFCFCLAPTTFDGW